MRVLITGASGFAGCHLAEHCLTQGDDVWGACRPGERVTHLTPLLDRLNLRIGDTSRPEFLRGLLGETRFDVLFHLAGITFVPEAEESPRRAYEVNVLGGIHVLQAAIELQPHMRVVLVSSAEVYGRAPPEDLPVVETHSFAPLNILAATKAALEIAAHPFVHTHGLHVVVARPFNHTGPREGQEFVCSSLARQIASIEAGAEPTVAAGDLSAKRDFCDVRDVVRGYRLLALHGQKGEAYNLASGQSVTVGHVLELLMRMTRTQVKVRPDPARVRRSEVLDVFGSCEKIRQCCGWKPEISLERSLRDLLNWHRDEQLREPTGSGD